MKLYLGKQEIKGVAIAMTVSVDGISDATATPEKVLSPEVYYDNEGRKEGTMPNKGSVSKSLTLGEVYTIEKGYHDGTGKVVAPNIKLQTYYYGANEPSADLGVDGDLYFKMEG